MNLKRLAIITAIMSLFSCSDSSGGHFKNFENNFRNISNSNNFSNAFNYRSTGAESVNPRTGTVHCEFTDISIQGINGHNFVLKSRYDQNNPHDRFGLGRGWSFNLTYIQNHHIYFSNGEVYRIRFSNPAELEYYKAKDKKISWYTKFRGIRSYSKFKVEYLNGTIEYIDHAGNMICTEDRFGNRIQFAYNGNKIYGAIDTYGNKIMFSNMNRTITVNLPDGNKFIYIINALVPLQRRIDSSGNATEFIYDDDQITLKEIRYPTGARSVYEFVKFDVGNYYVNAVKTVKKYSDYNNDDNDPELEEYEYGENNYIGADSFCKSNEDSSKNYIYKTTIKKNGIKIANEYNQYHLLKTKKIYISETDEILTKTENYYSSDTVLYENLTATYNLPVKIVSTLYKKDGNTNKILTDKFEYDEYFNIVKNIDAAGVVTNYQYDYRFGLLTKKEIQPAADSSDKNRTMNYELTPDGKNILYGKTNYTKNENEYYSRVKYSYYSDGRIEKIETESNDPDSVNSSKKFNYFSKPNQRLKSGIFNINEVEEISYISDWKGEKKEHKKITRFQKETGFLLSVTNGNGNTVEFQYNAVGQIIKQLNPDDTFKEYTYVLKEPIFTRPGQDNPGNEFNYIKITNESGYITRKITDGFSRTIKMQEKNGAIWKDKYQCGYNAYGQKIWEINPRGNKIEYKYDLLNREIEKKYPGNEIVATMYDDDRNRKLVINETGKYYCIQFDDFGRESKIFSISDITQISSEEFLSLTDEVLEEKITEGLVYVTEYKYDTYGNKIEQINNDSLSVKMQYDELNRLIEIENPNQAYIRYKYNTQSKVIQAKVEKDGITKYLPVRKFNEAGQLLEEIDNLNNADKFEYDGAGNLVKKIDKKGQTIEYIYDNMNRLAVMDNVIYTHTASGQMKTMEDETGVTAYEYYPDGKLKKEIYPDKKEIYYEYNECGSISKIIDFSGKEVTYSYDAKGRITEVEEKENQSESFITKYSYNPDNLLKYLEKPNGTKSEYEYDSLNQLVKLTNKDSNGTILSNFDYTYNKSGNKLSKNATYIDITKDINIDYEYDSAGRLSKATETGYNDEDTKTYTYDLMNNIIQLATDKGNIDYSYDPLNRLTEEDNEIKSTKFEYSYDENGNLTYKYISKADGSPSEVDEVYKYDKLNRLIGYENVKNDNATFYNYRGDGLRVEKINSERKINFYYHKQKIINELENGKLSSNVFGLKRISREYDGQKIYYDYNAHGDVVSLTDYEGKQLKNYGYEEFGELRYTEETVNNPFRYSGKYFDKESGLYYFKARYYSSELKRFITVDPAKDGLNWYVYCDNNPLNSIDPDGLNAIAWGAVGGFFIGGASSIIQQVYDDKNDFSIMKAFGGAVGGAIAGAGLGLVATYGVGATIYSIGLGTVGSITERWIQEGFSSAFSLKNLGDSVIDGGINGTVGLLGHGIGKLGLKFFPGSKVLKCFGGTSFARVSYIPKKTIIKFLTIESGKTLIETIADIIADNTNNSGNNSDVNDSDTNNITYDYYYKMGYRLSYWMNVCGNGGDPQGKNWDEWYSINNYVRKEKGEVLKNWKKGWDAAEEDYKNGEKCKF